MLAAAKGVDVTVDQLRGIAADAYDSERVGTLRATHGVGTVEHRYLRQKLRAREDFEDDTLYLQAFKEGESQSGA
jgi:hypothetical protein